MTYFDKAVEAVLKEAIERGEFDDLPGKGRPIDLTAYFETPEEVRAAYSILKNAGMVPREVELLREIAELKQIMATLPDENKKKDIKKQIERKQMDFSLMMERNRRRRS